MVIALLGLMCWTTGSTGAAFSIEEEFLQLKIQMKDVVKSLESKVTELESTIQEKVIEFELKGIQLEKIDAEMQEKMTEMHEKMAKLEAKVKEQDSLLFDLLREKNEPIKTNQQWPLASINGLPSSCNDLKMIGHIWSGFYLVMGPSMMESIYCDFSKLPSDVGFQKWIGYTDVKSVPVHFYVQRNSKFSTKSIPIPFHVAVVNEGDAMNLTSGIFTAPRKGIYFFSFTGLAQFPASPSIVHLQVSIYLNGGVIGTARTEEKNTDVNQLSPLTLQSTINLKRGDLLWVEMGMSSGVTLYEDSNWNYIHFMGFLLEEEIVASL